MKTLGQRDRQIIWHPFTQEKTAPLPIGIIRGEGATLYDDQGRTHLDLVSSWWTNLHGHSHPAIAAAIYKQALALEHVLFAGFTHAPAVELCEQLGEILPKGLSRFFFSDNGSTAVEVALKIAYQYWCNQGEKERRLFLAFDGGYHGDTFGAMSVGRSSGFHDHFSPLFFEARTIPYPYTWEGDPDVATKEAAALEALYGYLEAHGEQTAAFIAEPLIQGSSGMRPCRPQFVAAVMDAVQGRGIPVIFDEVMTGFGRTGTLFAAEQVGRTPDLLCVSKGLTGGFLPMGMTITTQAIYESFLGDHYDKAFSHGHTYTANPLGCAAAVASLQLLRDPSMPARWEEIKEAHKRGLALLQESCQGVVAPRIVGTIAAFNMHSTQVTYTHPIAGKIMKYFSDEGLLLRPLGNAIYLLPPYCITTTELENAYHKIAIGLSQL